MAGIPGSSALDAYDAARRRRRTVRAVVGLSATAAAGAGVLTAVAGSLGVGVVVVAAGFFVLILVFRAGPGDVDRWQRGALGERATASLLDALPPRRWSVWHDLRIPGSAANVDHVVIGRTGVWVVDSKTTRAVVRAGWRTVRFGDRRLDTGPARWEAEVVAARLAGVLDRPVPVRPIVAVHGSGLRPRGGRAGGVRVVPASHLTRRLRRGRRRLARNEASALAEALEQEFLDA